MKTIIEMPEFLFREAKSKAAERSQTLNAFVAEAMREKLASEVSAASTGEPERMQGFGKLRWLRKETVRMHARIENTFEVIEPEGHR